MTAVLMNQKFTHIIYIIFLWCCVAGLNLFERKGILLPLWALFNLSVRMAAQWLLCHRRISTSMYKISQLQVLADQFLGILNREEKNIPMTAVCHRYRYHFIQARIGGLLLYIRGHTSWYQSRERLAHIWQWNRGLLLLFWLSPQIGCFQNILLSLAKTYLLH